MAITQLQPNALPGKRRVFSAKSGSAVCVNIVYLTATTGFIWYVEEAAPFEDDYIINGGGNSVVVDGDPAPDPTFYPQGEVKILTGDNAGERRDVIKDIGNKTTLMWPLPNNLVIGDTYLIYPGCDKSAAEACRDKFDNAKNFRGMIYMPKLEEAL